MTTSVRTLVIGAGVIGAAATYKLSLDGEVYNVERSLRIPGRNQSTRSNQVVHVGIYDKKREPKKAKHCIIGNAEIYELTTEHNIPCERTGKVIVANGENEEEYLKYIRRIATENDIEFKELSQPELKVMQPNITATSVLYFPSSGVVDVVQLIRKLKALAEECGAHFAPGNEVVAIESKEKNLIVHVKNSGRIETFEADAVVNCCGLYADKIAKIVDRDSPHEIQYVRGEGAKFYVTREELNTRNMNVYPVPYAYYNRTGERTNVGVEKLEKLLDSGEATLTVGLHITPTFDLIENIYALGKTSIISPLKTIVKDPEDYESNKKQPGEYLKAIQPILNGLRLEDISLHTTGIMAVVKGHSDFVIEPSRKNPRFFNVIAPSPGITAALSIGDCIREWRRNL